MKDEELLQLAAKAVGCIDDAQSDDNSYGLHKSEHGQVYITDANGWRDWAPLEDDGDALRLAVKLNIGVQSHAFAGDYSLASNGDVSVCELHQGDPYAATRRAIVRAASEISKAMP